MAQLPKPASQPRTFHSLNETETMVKDPETGRLVTVKGLGALAHRPLELKKDIDLLQPIAEQVLGKRRKRKNG